MQFIHSFVHPLIDATEAEKTYQTHTEDTVRYDTRTHSDSSVDDGQIDGRFENFALKFSAPN